MHVEMMEAAKTFVESTVNRPVVGGFVSPSHNLYLSNKIGYPRYIPGAVRIGLARVALRNNDWLSVSTWEAHQVLRRMIQTHSGFVLASLQNTHSYTPASPLALLVLSISHSALFLLPVVLHLIIVVQSDFEDLEIVLRAHDEYLQKQFPDSGLTLFYVAGADHAVRVSSFRL